MSILVRRINRAKWDQIIDETDINDSSADAITNCLKTTNNDLSVWKIDIETEINDAILALITGSQQAKLSTIHYVMFDEEELNEKGIIISETLGDTIVEELKDKHRDLSKLTYKKLGLIKDIIVTAITENKSSFMTRSDLKSLLKKSIQEGKVNLESLNPDLITNEKL